MSEKKRYGRQIFLSFIVTIIILLGGLYLASQYLLPNVTWDQGQLFDFFVKLFPLLIGLIMIEIGVVISKKKVQDCEDEFDKLPPNAYDRPFYALPQDDPAHIRNDEIIYTQPHVLAEATFADEVLDELPISESTAEVILPIDLPPVIDEEEVIEAVEEEPVVEEEIIEVVEEPVAEEEIVEVVEEPVVEEEPLIFETPVEEEVAPVAVSEESSEEEFFLEEDAPVVPVYRAAPVALDDTAVGLKEETLQVYEMDFESILAVELESANDLNYDLTVVVVRVTSGPIEAIANKLIRQSGDLSYSFFIEDESIALILPFYNSDEARSFTLSLIEACQREFQGSELEIGFASRNGREVGKDEILKEARRAASF
ncbi:MAG: hypothetical protein WC954_00695 [Sphaerochaeta sp.]|jgi:hypothetical protein